MPRVQESQEGRILRWFRTAPLTAATMLLALVKDAVRERHTHKVAAVRADTEAKSRAVAAIKPKAKRKKSHHTAVSHHAAPPAAPKARVRHRRPRTTPLEEGDSFTSGELEG